ncbi:hypothetical protein HJC10_05830 [Corallococcus exiguus]|uniref:hypothetical protein n=1 Tax=Corallococcus TaxID=83461 RepID=UPI000EC1650F|nr:MULTISPECIES: hypothetical protein [Corallococcus]NNB86826.1 hypothetical protein [Corallococcus exiguus]NNB93844.1 hypothetical protein [Corallococcus exiguus]NNC02375.1 hypothetical protein [Corallococcus exiguus]NPC49231.1 hypothetical protein [Corallococcus exiguus]RKH82980.1 hypothetical protein D7X99_14105 [Corallococcus sp. AB032C]
MIRASRLGLLLLGLSACGERVDGMTVTLGLEHRATAQGVQAAGGERSFTRADGQVLTLTRGYVALNSVELKPCEEALGWRLLRALSPIGTAHAHSEGSPLRLGTPHVSGLERPDGNVLTLGTVRPPPGRYCRARLTFEAADADAEGLSDVAHGVDMVGRTLWLEGTRVPAGGGEPQPFRLVTSNIATVDVVLDELTLSEDEPAAERTFALAWDTWLATVDLESPGAAASALDTVARSVAMSSVAP